MVFPMHTETAAWSEPTEIFIDDRGWLMAAAQDFRTWPFNPVRMYAVCNFDIRTIRGLHHHYGEFKAFIVIQGSILFGWLKDETFKYDVVSAKKPAIYFVAPETWHGWRALEPDSIMLGFSNFDLKQTQEDDQRSQEIPEGAFQVKNR